MVEEEPLLHQIYKVIYFPTTQFSNSKLGCNPSYTWRGIHETIPWIHNRSLQRVGDGHSVQVWKVAWILDLPAPFQNYLPESGLGANMGVKDLICADTSSWDSKKKKKSWRSSHQLWLRQFAILSSSPRISRIKSYGGRRKAANLVLKDPTK